MLNIAPFSFFDVFLRFGGAGVKAGVKAVFKAYKLHRLATSRSTLQQLHRISYYFLKTYLLFLTRGSFEGARGGHGPE